jgi:low temperature requirement protein LtrA
VLRAALIFGNVWWMYGGYAWLTNAVPPRAAPVRLLLLVGMAGFLLIALSIPTAFGSGGVIFGLGYVVVTLVHTGLFLRSSQQSVFKAVGRLGPFNAVSAALLLVAGFTSTNLRVALFGLGFVLHWVTPYLSGTGGFRIRSGHFVERHGLILLIAIGESVVAVGIGLGQVELPTGRIITALLGLALAAGLWWLYFSADDARAENALEEAPEVRRPQMALNAFGYAFLATLGGIVLVAAGMKLAIVHYSEPATTAAALFLAVGVGLYALSLAWFRWILDSGSPTIRLVLAGLALPTALIGIKVSSLTQLTVLVAIVTSAAASASME